MRSRWAFGFLAMGGLGVVACANAGDGGKVVRPKQPTAQETLGTAPAATPKVCHAPQEEAEPYVIDWPVERRGELLDAMSKGVAFVSYDCNGTRILRDCSLPGAYAFVGMSPDERTVQLHDEDELAVNFGSGTGLKLGGDLARSSAIDIALITVGRSTASRQAVARPHLPKGGSCKAATHFVRAVSMGAFAMRSGTRGRVAAAAELFGQGTSGASGSSRHEETRSGRADACSSAKTNATTAPSGCETPLRLLVVGLSNEDAPAPAEPPRPECPTGYVLSEGVCTKPVQARPHQCREGDLADCQAQCNAGDSPSCVDAAYAFEKGKGTTRDDRKAYAHYAKACTAGDAAGCAGIGFMTLYGKGLPSDPKGAYELLARACDQANARGCNGVGIIHHRGRLGAKDPTRALVAFDRACRLGFPGACLNVGNLFDDKELPKDDTRMFLAFSRTCELGDARGCFEQAKLLRAGVGTPKDPQKADDIEKASLAQVGAGCTKNDSAACETLARAHLRGTGTPKDSTKAAGLFEAACNYGQADSCAQLGLMTGKGDGVAQDAAKSDQLYTQACKLGHEKSCARLAEKGAPLPSKDLAPSSTEPLPTPPKLPPRRDDAGY